MAFVKQSEFADLCGVSRQAVLKWKQEGKLVLQGARIDVDASLARLGRIRRGGSPVSTGNQSAETIEIEIKPGETLDDAAERLVGERLVGELDIDSTSFDEARRHKEIYLALLNRLSYEEKSRSVIDLDLARSVFFETHHAQRDAWLNWPSKVAPHVAARLKVDTDSVLNILTEFVHKQVSELGEPQADFDE